MNGEFWLLLTDFVVVLENLLKKVTTNESLGSFHLEANIFHMLDVYRIFLYCFKGRSPLLKYSTHLQLLINQRKKNERVMGNT